MNFSEQIDLLWDNHIIEISVLVVLAIITIFRRKLSSNHEYRSSKTESIKSKIYSVNISYEAQLGKWSNKSIEKHISMVVTSNSNLNNISIDIIVNIVVHLNLNDIANLMRSSKQLLKDIRSDTVWEQLWIQTYGYMWQCEVIKTIRESKNIYWDPMKNFGPPQKVLKFEYQILL